MARDDEVKAKCDCGGGDGVVEIGPRLEWIKRNCGVAVTPRRRFGRVVVRDNGDDGEGEEEV